MPGVVLARIIYRSDSRRSLNRLAPWRIPAEALLPRCNRRRCVSRQIHPPVPRSSFIGARRVNLKPAGVSSTPGDASAPVAAAFRSDKPLVTIVSARYIRASVFYSLPSAGGEFRG